MIKDTKRCREIVDDLRALDVPEGVLRPIIEEIEKDERRAATHAEIRRSREAYYQHQQCDPAPGGCMVEGNDDEIG